MLHFTSSRSTCVFVDKYPRARYYLPPSVRAKHVHVGCQTFQCNDTELEFLARHGVSHMADAHIRLPLTLDMYFFSWSHPEKLLQPMASASR